MAKNQAHKKVKHVSTPRKSTFTKAKGEIICNARREKCLTNVQLAALVGACDDTLARWKAANAEFAEALKKAEEDYTQMMNQLCVDSLKELMTPHFIGNKYYPPNLGAIIHWQTNKQPEQWKNRQSTELTGTGGKDLIPEPLTIEVVATIQEEESVQEAVRKIGFSSDEA